MNARAMKDRAVILTAALLLSACAAQQGSVPLAELHSAPIIRATPPDPNTPAPPPVGTDENTLRAEFGAPDFVRNETESQLWRYDGDNCALFFFLYHERDSYVLRYTETDPVGEDGTVDSDCLSRIKQAGAPAS